MRRLAWRNRYGRKAGSPVQTIATLLPAETSWTMGVELPSKVHAGVAVAAVAAEGAAVTIPSEIHMRASPTDTNLIVH
jgi:hypothetical protein